MKMDLEGAIRLASMIDMEEQAIEVVDEAEENGTLEPTTAKVLRWLLEKRIASRP